MVNFSTNVANIANRVIFGHLKIIDLKEKDFVLQDCKGNTILHYLSSKDTDLLNEIGNINQVANFINIQNAKGMTPLHVSIKYNTSKNFLSLLNAGSDIFLDDINKESCIELAIKNDNFKFFEKIFENPKTLNQLLQKRFGGFPITILAMKYGSENCLEFFSNSDVRILEQKDLDGNTALLFGIAHNNEKFVSKLLRSESVNLEAQNLLSIGVLDMALRSESKEILLSILNSKVEVSEEQGYIIGKRCAHYLMEIFINYTFDKKGNFIGILNPEELENQLLNFIFNIPIFQTQKKQDNIKKAIKNCINKIMTIEAKTQYLVLTPTLKELLGNIAHA